MSQLSIAQVMDETMAYLLRAPLVWMEGDYFVFRDPDNDGFRYDFKTGDALDALLCASHMAAKSWVTTDHLEQFALLAHGYFMGRRT